MKCCICRRDTHRHACDTCLTTTRRRLRETELYAAWLTLPDLLTPIRSNNGRGAPGYASRPPIRLDAVAMSDPRSRLNPPPVDEDRGIGHPDDTDTTWPILDTLNQLANDVRAQLQHPNPPAVTLAGEVGYLLSQLDRCAYEPWIADLADHIRTLHAQARAVAHDQPPGPLGTCLVVGCGGQVYPPPPRRDTTRCSSCGRPYTGLDLVRLRTQEDAG